jgi:preprotein translocase YajC subunit
MAWYCHYLPNFNIQLFNWTVIILLGFEIVYIAVQAGRGQLSHYNVGTPFYSFLYSMMAIAASVVTLYTAYVGLLFFTTDFPDLPYYYVWAIRLGIFIFVIFYFLLIRPQQKKAKEHAKLVDSIKTGDQVVTNAGIHGVVANVKEKTLIIKIADNVKVEFDRAAVAAVEKSADKESAGS